MTVSSKMRAFNEKSSWIRRMFEEGARMKAEFGADQVFDFSLGNPDVPAPPEFDAALREAAAETGPGVHGYMPNGGYPWVREALAELGESVIEPVLQAFAVAEDEEHRH